MEYTYTKWLEPYFKNYSASTMSGFSQLWCLVIVIPADENVHSLETDDAIIGSISHARDAQTGY